MRNIFKLAAYAASLAMLVTAAPNGSAETVYKAHVSQAHRTYHQPVTAHAYFADHPKVRAATIGAGVGTAAGAVTGLVTGRGVVRGALIGAGTGAGVGLVRSSHTMRRHPIVKDIATGSLVGMGLGFAGGRHHGTAARATLVGGAAGLATGLLTHGL